MSMTLGETPSRVPSVGGFAEAVGGIPTNVLAVVLAVPGLAGTRPMLMVGIATASWVLPC